LCATPHLPALQLEDGVGPLDAQSGHDDEDVDVLPRFHIEGLPLEAGLELALPDGAARHVQVLRMQPGDALQLFDGAGREWQAQVTEMGRKHVSTRVERAVDAPARELPVRVTLAIGMPANDRMDALVEKAAELGAHAIQPLLCERAVLRLDGDRAKKKVAHWQAVAVSACEQSGRAVVPHVHEIKPFQAWLRDMGAEAATARAVLSLREAISMRAWLTHLGTWAQGGDRPQASLGLAAEHIVFLSGPEGGLSPAEEQAALNQGWQAVSLGHRVLRADTAPIAALSVMACAHEA
jgi:16S rRNA (uracil1498-N3)-methyltransferase